MRWGLIARAETDRGLGIQSLSMFQNLHPDRTLVVDVPQSGFAAHVENYPGSWKVTYDDGLPEDIVRDWWSDLDVVVSVETFYDDRYKLWADADGVRTVIQGNPEFVKPGGVQPHQWWWPTDWRLDKLPPGKIVPVPVPSDAPIRRAQTDDTINFLHIAGNRAMADRNGTNIVREAIRRNLDKRSHLTAYCQKGELDFTRTSRQAIEHEPVTDRWSMYDGQHVLVYPRRFGGLSLPTLEAIASGVVVMMPDCSPNLDWPIWPLPSAPSKVIQTPAGDVQTFDVLSNDLRTAMNAVAASPRLLDPYHERMEEWVDHNCWSGLAPIYHDAIETAARR